ncbi:MAG TPA: cyclic nucleotide-binding domain-containing protein [Candidatus Limnocylindrales bacterium]|nr:cyclic nucleotide-binding domain-containing protein [Candidatus Limnocylindrales bacterium]
MATDQKLELVRSVPMFCRLGRSEQEQVAGLLDEVDVPAGRVLMRQGDPGREMFIVVSGTFRVDRDGRQIAERGPGSVLGEISLISEGPRTATITASSPARLLVAGHREFHDLMDGHPAVKMQVLEGLAEKVRVLESDGLH